ncbi:MAG: RNA polymerase sigma factor [Planctomycetes bacterium]|nr:RNA polymerase sigma factor [Planctomycetota bacterium]
MQATDPQGLALTREAARARLQVRLADVAGELAAEERARCAALVADPERDVESLRDAVSTRLMESFRTRNGRATFGLLYELNADHILLQVAGRLRRFASRSDPRDVLQEVFFNIYRYPHRFNAEREDAFRVWSAMIVRNTVLKHLRSLGRAAKHQVAAEDLHAQPAVPASSPLSGAIEAESQGECARVYLTYLHLYLHFYGMLSERERAALHMVEVDETSYRAAAEALGIKLENLKMVIFRARRKIQRAMKRTFEGLSADCRPARDGRVLLAGAGRAELLGSAEDAELAGGAGVDRRPEADASEVE